MAVALAGAGAAATQVVVIRELLVASAGNELSVAAVLAAWLLWSAAGSWLGGRVVSRSERPPEAHFTGIALVEVVVAFGALGLARAGLWGLRKVFGGVLVLRGVVPPPGGMLSFPQLLLLTTLVTAPVGLVLGWQFAAGCALLRESQANTQGPDSQTREGAARAYICDSLGHLAGGAALSVAAVTRISAELILTVALAGLLAGAWLLQPDLRRLGAGFMLMAGMLIAGPRFRTTTLALRWAPHKLAASLDGPMGNVAVGEGAGGELDFFSNGIHAFETGLAPAGEQWVHIPLLAHPRPNRVLLIGGGPRALQVVLSHNPQFVAYFELDPTIIRAIRQLAPPHIRRPLDDPRVTISLGDARLRLPSLLKAGERFDVILIAVGDPTTAQVNRYYTRGWFGQVRVALTPGGVAAFQALSSGEYLSKDLRAYNACLVRTAEAAGLKVAIFPGEYMTVLGCAEGTRISVFDDAVALEQRIRSRGLDSITLLASLYDALDPFRREDRQRELDQTTGVRLNDDFAPTCYYYAQRLWASWWGGKTAAILAYAQKLQLWHVVGLVGVWVAIMVALSRITKRPSQVVAPQALLAAGMGGVALEIVLLIALQSLYGYLYGIVGYVVGVLMAGLAAGAWWASRRPPKQPHIALAATQVGLALAAGASLASLMGLRSLSQLPAAPSSVPVIVISLLMGITGLVVGAAFPQAIALVRSHTVGGATALYASDLIGACVGALLTGLVLVPLLGIPVTCAIVAALGTASALVCLLAYQLGS